MLARWSYCLSMLLPAFAVWASPSFGCSCGGGDRGVPVPSWTCPTLQALEASEAAFLGTPISVEGPEDLKIFSWPRVYVYHFRVDDNIYGADSKEVDVYTGIGGGDCATSFTIGLKYLVDAGKSRGLLTTSICRGNELASNAESRIAELRARRRETYGPSSIHGYLHLDRMPPYGISPLDGKPVTGVTIHMVSSDGRTFTTQTNQSGIFDLDNVPAGSYHFVADLPPNLALDPYTSGTERPYRFPDRACLDVDLRANPAVPKAAVEAP
jgi:hypothetical protein